MTDQENASSAFERRINRRRVLQGAAALGMSAPLLSGAIGPRVYYASAQDASDGILTVSQEQQQTWVKNFNPFLPDSSGSRWPTQAGIYEPSMIWNTIKGELVPWLATDYKFNSDNTELTFTYRDDVKWSDGTAFSAKDVAYTFNLLKSNSGLTSPSGATTAFGDTGYLSSVTASDDKTVVFKFSRVFTPGLYDLAGQPIVPEHIWSKVDDPVSFTNETPVATGPYTEITRFEDQVWQLEKNPNYWQEGLPKVQGFRMPAYPGNDQANLATINGDNDWAGNFIPDIDKTFVAKDKDNHKYWFPSTGAVVHLYALTTKAPWNDINVRKALSLAIDRDKIAGIGEYGYTHGADGTGMSDAFQSLKDQAALDAGAEWVKYDPDAANKLLDDAGYTKDGDTRKLPDGTPMEYDLNVVTGWSDWVSSCQIMAQGLAAIGIKANVQPYDVSTWQDRVQKGDFDLTIGWSSQGATALNFYRGVMSPETIHKVGETGTENWQRYGSDTAKDLLAQFAATADADEQKEIVAKLSMAYATEVPAIPLFPGPQWGEFSTARFTGFPDADNPYAILSTYAFPERLIVMTTIEPKAS